MGALMGPMAFDAAAQKAKRDIQDALGSYRRMPQPPQAPQPRAQAQVMPNGMQMSAQVPMGQNQMQFGMQTQGMRPQDLMARYSTPNQSFGVNYQPQNKGVMATYARRFQEGGLATSLRMGDNYEQDKDFVAAANQQMQNMVAKPFAKGGLAMAEGGAWTRKEGKNPEGGLNAKGRASLRAQGHDIKPPVSAKQAKKSPKAAARRKSFCARMSGMPGPMKDDKGRPTRKALSLRKWDC